MIHEFINHFYITMNIDPSSNSIPRLKINNTLNMNSSEERGSNNRSSNDNSRRLRSVRTMPRQVSGETYRSFTNRVMASLTSVERRLLFGNLDGEERNLVYENLTREQKNEWLDEAIRRRDARWAVEKQLYPNLNFQEWDRLVDEAQRSASRDDPRYNDINRNTLPPITSSDRTQLSPQEQSNNNASGSNSQRPLEPKGYTTYEREEKDYREKKN